MLDYRKRKNKKNWWLTIFTVGVVLLVALISLGRSWLTGPVIFLVKPFWQAGDNLSGALALQLNNLGQSRQALLVQNKNLQDENDKLKVFLLAKNNVESDNAKLRTILGQSQEKIKPIMVEVIFLPNFVPYNNLLLDIGSANSNRSVKIGDLVVADNSVLVGRLVEIDKNYSKARLISAETNLPVVIGGKNIPAVANGSGVGNFTITLPKDTPIAIGDTVRTPLFNNYLIGSVGHIEKLASRPTQTVLVRTPINLFQLKWLEIYEAKT